MSESLLSQVARLAREESAKEEEVAIEYERDGMIGASIPHLAASAALERFARRVERLEGSYDGRHGRFRENRRAQLHDD